MSARVWIVSELYYPEITSTGYYVTGIAEALGREFDVRVLSGQPTYAERGVRAPTTETRGNVKIRRCRGTTMDKDVLPFRLLNTVSFGLSAFLAAVRRFRPSDAVIVVTNPPLLPFLILLAARIRGAKCAVLVHDVYPEALVAAGLVRPKGWVARLMRLASAWLYRRARAVVVLGHDMGQLIARRCPAAASRISIISNWADTTEIQPLDRSTNSFLQRLGLSEKFVVQWSGNIGRTHGSDLLVDMAECFGSDPSVHFILVGSGGKAKWLRETVRDRGLGNVTLLDRQPRTLLCELLNACDVAIVAFVPGMAGVSVPSRVYNILAAGKPLVAVADPESEVARIVGEDQVGWVSSPGNVQAAVEAIRDARSNPARLAEMGHRARATAVRDYSPERVFDQYRSLVLRLHHDRT